MSKEKEKSDSVPANDSGKLAEQQLARLLGVEKCGDVELAALKKAGALSQLEGSVVLTAAILGVDLSALEVPEKPGK